MAGKNVCQCQAPPGGLVQCEPHQLAYCRVVNNVSETGCVDAPNTAKLAAHDAQRVIQNWALATITKSSRSALDNVDPREAKMLMDGEYRDVKTGERVRFTMPQPMRRGGGGGSGGGFDGDRGSDGPQTPNFENERDAERFWTSAVFDENGVIRMLAFT
jgi:hypothetical protein